MSRDLEFNGKPKLDRKRLLSEELGSVLQNILTRDRLPVQKEPDLRQERVDILFTDLARTLIKSDIVKNGLALMDPAQEIPIDEFDEKTRAAARRLDERQSRNGEVITYSMYQNAVDSTLAINWNLRVKFLNVKTPATTFSSQNEVSYTKSKGYSELGNLLKEFLEENGIAGSIISMLTLAPFQGIIFQTLTVEEGAKTVQALQVPAGLSLLIELGIKAEKIYEFMKKCKLDNAQVEQQITHLGINSQARAEALKEFGVDYEDLKSSLSPNDNETIIDYVSSYYARYGGLVAPSSHLTLDHWIGYLEVSRTQLLLRSAVNSADKYSQKFKNFKAAPETEFSTEDLNPESSPRVKIHLDLASTLRSLDNYSNTIFDDIVDAFSHQISDRAICCLVSIFGYPGDDNLNMLRTIAYILRILSVDLSGDLIQINNVARRFIARKLQSAIFEVLTQLNTVYDKVQNKLAKAFTVDIKGLENCSGMLTLGFALNQSFDLIYRKMRDLIQEISSAIINYGSVEDGTWEVAADRRELLGIARVLEILASRLEVANICSNTSREKIDTSSVSQDIKDEAARNIIHTLLDKSPPSIQISDSDYTKYFNTPTQKYSSNLKYGYGRAVIGASMTDVNKCGEMSEEDLNRVSESFWTSIKQAFSDDQ